jgi:hypothetical protein
VGGAAAQDVQLRSPITRIDLFTVVPAAIPLALVRMATDRRALRRQPDLTFWKLLGTGDGRTFDARDADLRRWGVLTVWPGQHSAQRFADATLLDGWRRLATEHWWATLRPVRAKGEWSQRQPFGPPFVDAAPDVPIAALTRARLRWSRAARFWRAIPPVNADLAARQGLLLRLGIGEAPIGLQGTFSLWRNLEALHAFAYRAQPHREVIGRSGRERWYAEELFVRFAITASGGTIFALDPLVGRADGPAHGEP